MKHVKKPTQEPSQEIAHEVHVACEICLAEVPISGARSAEISDYVAYFCGVDCYDKWHKHHEEEEESSS